MYAAGDTLGARPRESRPSSVGVFTGKVLGDILPSCWGGNFACVFCRAMEWGGCVTTHERATGLLMAKAKLAGQRLEKACVGCWSWCSGGHVVRTVPPNFRALHFDVM